MQYVLFLTLRYKMKDTRKAIGKSWKQGRFKGDAEKYYLEFKEEIDMELGISGEEEVKEVKNKKRGK